MRLSEFQTFRADEASTELPSRSSKPLAGPFAASRALLNEFAIASAIVLRPMLGVGLAAELVS